MQRDRSGVHDLLKRINDKDTLQVFTDEGLLPNYAFPEEGVTLHSIILRRKEKPDEHGAYTVRRYDYERPAAVALMELAPGNSFYAGGRKLTIDQVSVGLSPTETWHFCDTCTYMERADSVAPTVSQCPRCQSTNWNDASLLKPMLRMRQVVTTVSDHKSRIADDKDERDLHFFSRHMSVDIDAGQMEKAYQLTEIAFPFGFEFIRRVTLREVNLGTQDPGAESLRIGGREHQCRGFRLCRECGKVQTAANRIRWKHDISCSKRGKETEDEVLDAIFLYRELTSEALRILIPSAGDDGDVRIASFHAAVYVGLREHFGGNIDHLESAIQEMPIPEMPSLRRRYLILYDKVPGGTGYLKELMRSPEGLLTVLRKAQSAIAGCTCETDPDKDGCHRCVRAYRLRRDHSRISRRRALEVLNALLAPDAKLEELAGGLSAIDINPLVQSELEQRFLEALRSKGGFKLETRVVRGRPGYLLTIPGKPAAWELALQVDVTAKDGASVPSRPDLVFYPLRAGSDGRSARPVAVFLDGFAFHADATTGNNRIGEDLGKRMAILHGAGWRVWSVTWDDVHATPDQKELVFKPYGEALAATRSGQLEKVISKEQREQCGIVHVERSHSLGLLFSWLRNPAEDIWQMQSLHYGMFWGAPSRGTWSAFHQSIGELTAQTVPAGSGGKSGEAILSRFDDVGEDGITIRVRGSFAVSLADMASRNASGAKALLWFNDAATTGCIVSRIEWSGMLRLVNLMQFLPGFHAVSAAGLSGGWAAGIMDALLEENVSSEPKPDLDPAWNELLSLTDPSVHPLLSELAAQHLPTPDAGFELLGPAGTIIASAELGWGAPKVAVLLDASTPDGAEFLAAGWTVFFLPGAETAAIGAALKSPKS